MPELGTSQTIPRLNAVRVIVALVIALGYASTMPIGPGNPEALWHLGHDPSWFGIQLLFFISGYLALRTVRRHGSAKTYLLSRFTRIMPSLVLFTFVAAFVIYPLLGVMSDTPGAILGKLSLYFFATVSCLDPGRVLPGLLDNALYMCLIQGGIWTLRWGLIAHICVAIGTRLGLFKSNIFILSIAIICAAAYFACEYIFAKQGYAWLATPSLALRLSYAFLAGMALFAYQGALPKTAKGKALTLSVLALSAVTWYYYLPWTPAIEMLTTGFWAYLAIVIILSRTPKLAVFDHWPGLALNIYLVNWPVSQLLVLKFPNIGSWGLIAVSLPTSVAIAALIHALLSKRAFTYARRAGIKSATA